MTDLTGKTALVAGSAQGIGFAVAKAPARLWSATKGTIDRLV